ncbi:ADP-ribosylglycohydrolase family protein [Streptomyces diastatochromogenes]|nr:ADP-ribosylglycohydrolase family protein [Streptomyces diastatochromogenes]
MNQPWQQSWEAAAVYRSRVRGCLLGGAVGDALGYPVEFASLDRIRSLHGERGVTGLVPGGHGMVGRISDDTQMTLFTVEALVQAQAREREKGIGGGWSLLLRQAYERWLQTQSKPGPEEAEPPHGAGLLAEAWLYARRAPATPACPGSPRCTTPTPSSRSTAGRGDQPGLQGLRRGDALGPFGLVSPAGAAFAMAARGAQITTATPPATTRRAPWPRSWPTSSPGTPWRARC